MTPHDPLIQRLKTTDASLPLPLPPADLAAKVRNRQAHRAARSMRAKIGLASLPAAALIAAIIFAVHNSDLRTPTSELTRLRAEADALGAQADALERQLHYAHNEQVRQDLREEYRRQLAADAVAQTDQSPIDRAALIALCQGDYYRDQHAQQPAQAAYQSVLDNFPTSRWAAIAHDRLSQFQMN